MKKKNKMSEEEKSVTHCIFAAEGSNCSGHLHAGFYGASQFAVQIIERFKRKSYKEVFFF